MFKNVFGLKPMLKPMPASTALPAALVLPPGTLKTGLLPSAGQGAGSAAAAGEEKSALPDRPDLPNRPEQSEQPDDLSDDLFDLFDLRHLATPSRHMPDGPVTQSSQLDNPFGVLDIAGAERRPAGDALAELLGQLPPVAATPAVSYTDAIDAIDAAQHEGVGAAPVDLLLSDLHAEFVRVVRDPTQLTGRIDWDSVASSGDEPPPTLDELSQLAGPYRLLRDILQPCEGIDSIIANFDSLNPSTLLGNTQTEDVLRLFAPRLAQGVKVAVPGLTRREHHDLSPDSPMNLGAFAPDDKAAR